jgi:hypothetical protein
VDDYYEGVVTEYLRADPSMFVRPQSCIQLNAGPLKAAGQHWYCDIVAVRLRKPESVFLCEVSFAKTPKALFNRLLAWDACWPAVRVALARDNGLPESWPVRPWVFVRGDRRAFVSRRIAELLGPRARSDQMPEPLVTSFDDVTPWRYAPPLCLPADDATAEGPR